MTDSIAATPALSKPAGELEARNLGKTVRLPDHDLTILDGVSFRLHAGEAVAVVGASGSGKSTLLSLLAGLDTPSVGEAVLDGVVLSGLDEDGRARLRGDRDPAPAARAILGRVGLGERLDHYPRQLSRGEQQRVALARAFVTAPALLFADEPTGNLDTDTGRAVIDLLFELNAQSGTTLVLVTHDERLAARCTRVLRLAGGRLVADANT